MFAPTRTLTINHLTPYEEFFLATAVDVETSLLHEGRPPMDDTF